MKLAVRAFLVCFGLLFIALGFYIGVVMAGAARAGAERVVALAPFDAAALAAGAPGAPALVEGTVSPANQARYRSFVAYVREEFRGADSNGDDRWVEDERATPPLLIEAGGPVRLANADYALEGAHERWQEEGLNWSSRTQEGTKRYRGLVAGSPAFALGTIAEGAEGGQLRAEFVYGGTREAYLAERQGAAGFLPWLGLAIALAGAAVSLVGALALRRW